MYKNAYVLNKLIIIIMRHVRENGVQCTDSPANTKSRPNAGLLSANRRRRWPNPNPALGHIAGSFTVPVQKAQYMYLTPMLGQCWRSIVINKPTLN